MITVKRRISLDFLGDDYKESYLNIRAMSVAEYEELGDETIKDTVINHFIDGEIQQDSGTLKITKDNIRELPSEVFTVAFNVIAGVEDPKAEGQSKTQSTTAPPPQ